MVRAKEMERKDDASNISHAKYFVFAHHPPSNLKSKSILHFTRDRSKITNTMNLPTNNKNKDQDLKM
jgi:hypothetical protein